MQSVSVKNLIRQQKKCQTKPVYYWRFQYHAQSNIIHHEYQTKHSAMWDRCVLVRDGCVLVRDRCDLVRDGCVLVRDGCVLVRQGCEQFGTGIAVGQLGPILQWVRLSQDGCSSAGLTLDVYG
jgi:hypothetical protein